MTPQSDHAGVWFPPPFWYAFAVLGGVLLDRRWPLPIVGGRLITVAGAVCVLGWMALAFDAIDRFRRSKTTIVPIRPAEALCGLLLATWWPIVLLPPVLVIVQVFVILPEERYLRRRFGTPYDAYTRRVRRWL